MAAKPKAVATNVGSDPPTKPKPKTIKQLDAEFHVLEAESVIRHNLLSGRVSVLDKRLDAQEAAINDILARLQELQADKRASDWDAKQEATRRWTWGAVFDRNVEPVLATLVMLIGFGALAGLAYGVAWWVATW